MSTSNLHGKTIAIIATDGFEQVELTEPRKALETLGAKTVILSPKTGKIQGFNHVDKADSFDVDMEIGSADASKFDALLLPGGVVNADDIRINADAQNFVHAIDTAGKPIAVICHGAWILASAKLVSGRTLTSYPTLKDDLENAGAKWVDDEVIVDRNWISSRKPDDIPAFNKAFIKSLG